MKKPNRNFVVEYKSGRRRHDKGSNSIWGNIDLGSVAQDVDDASRPAVAPSPNEVKTVPFAGRQASILTAQVGQPTTAPALQEYTMADEDQTILAADVPKVAEPEVEKKVRKPRAKNSITETSAVDVSTEPAADKPKRGRKPKLGNTADDPKRSATKRAPKAEPVAPAAKGEAIDEIADLLQLEEENKTLRRLLAEKLRAENADLKTRLSLG
jgi:hypothetical protein